MSGLGFAPNGGAKDVTGELYATPGHISLTETLANAGGLSVQPIIDHSLNQDSSNIGDSTPRTPPVTQNNASGPMPEEYS